MLLLCNDFFFTPLVWTQQNFFTLFMHTNFLQWSINIIFEFSCMFEMDRFLVFFRRFPIWSGGQNSKFWWKYIFGHFCAKGVVRSRNKCHFRVQRVETDRMVYRINVFERNDFWPFFPVFRPGFRSDLKFSISNLPNFSRASFWVVYRGV